MTEIRHPNQLVVGKEYEIIHDNDENAEYNKKDLIFSESYNDDSGNATFVVFDDPTITKRHGERSSYAKHDYIFYPDSKTFVNDMVGDTIKIYSIPLDGEAPLFKGGRKRKTRRRRALKRRKSHRRRRY